MTKFLFTAAASICLLCANESRSAQVTISETVNATVAPWIKKEQPPGVIVVVRYDGKTQIFPFGETDKARHKPVKPDSIFELASVTKVFATTSLSLEVQAGRMRLDDSVVDYVPYLQKNGADIKRVTLKQLATHTSSLPRTPGDPPEWTKEALMHWFASWHAADPPGTKWLYSNIGIGLLGYAIENREQQPLIEVWRRQILKPLGMNDTYLAIPKSAPGQVVQGYNDQGLPIEHSPQGGWPAGGRLSSSGRDMGEFLVANLGERPDLPTLSKAMQFAQKPYFQASPTIMQGLAWDRLNLSSELIIDKNGGLDGTSTYIGMLPERHIGLVLMANRGKCTATIVGRTLLLKLIGKEYPVDGLGQKQ